MKMFEELGRYIAEYTWENREKLENVGLWEDISYDTAKLMLDNDMMSYFDFEYGTLDQCYDETMETLEGFKQRMQELLKEDPEWTMVETDEDIYITRKKQEQ